MPNLDLSIQRQLMIERDLKTRGITDQRVLQAMTVIPREKFVPVNFQNESYVDHPLPIGFGQTVSQPFIVALMCQLAQINSNQTVLDIGTGSGYQAAVLSKLARSVITIEIVPELYQRADLILQELKLKNVKSILGDAKKGYSPAAPFDTIVCAAATHRLPPAWTEQLKIGGKIVVPMVKDRCQILTIYIKIKKKSLKSLPLEEVAFVPLV